MQCRNHHEQEPGWKRCLICKRKSDLRYRHSEKGKASRVRYENGEAAKNRKKRYEDSKGTERRARWFANLSGPEYSLRCLKNRRANSLARRRNRKELDG